MRARRKTSSGIGGVGRCHFAWSLRTAGRATRARNAPGRCDPAGLAADTREPARPRSSLGFPGTLARHAQPGGFPLQASVHRMLYVAQCIRAARNTLASRDGLTHTHFMSGRTSQLPFARTPPHGPLRRFFGQFMGHDIPVELRTHCPHMRQSNSSPFTERSNAATGARAADSRFAGRPDVTR